MHHQVPNINLNKYTQYYFINQNHEQMEQYVKILFSYKYLHL